MPITYLVYEQTQNNNGHGSVSHCHVARPDGRLDPNTGQYPTVEAATLKLVDTRAAYRVVVDDGSVGTERYQGQF